MTTRSDDAAAFVRRMVHTDSMRTTRLQQIIRQYGWLDGSRAGETASEAAGLILQHSPSATFQRSMLPRLDTLAGVGEVSGQEVALLTDRALQR